MSTDYLSIPSDSTGAAIPPPTPQSPKKWRTPRGLKVLFGLALTMLIVNAALPILLLTRYQEAEEWHAHTHEVIAAIYELRSHLAAAESNQRTYILTSDAMHLNEFTEELFLADQGINRLRQLTIDNPSQQSRISVLAPMVAKRIEGMRAIVETAQVDGLDVALEHIRNRPGRVLMQDIINLVDVMQDDERRLALGREQTANKSSRLAGIGFAVGTLLNIALFSLVFYLLVRRYGGRLDAMVNSAMDGVLAFDEKEEIAIVNRAAESMFCRPAGAMVGMSITSLISKRDHQTLNQHIQALGTEQAEVMSREQTVVALTAVRANGEEFPIEATVSAADYGSRELSVAILRDVSVRHKAEREIQEALVRQKDLSRRLMEAEETERKNINRELHDRIGQNLSALMINAELLRTRLPPEDETAAGRIHDMQALLRATSDHVRNVMGELRPAALDDYGLVAALNLYAAPLAERIGMEINIDGDSLSFRPSLVTEIALFRIAQEALNNIAKHARAATVDIEISGADGKVEMKVRDDGDGFDAREKTFNASWGMRVMRERAEAVNGRVEVTSSPGEGTCVYVGVECGE